MNNQPLDLLVLFTRPPLTGLQAREGLDAALISSTFEQNTALAFIGEGVLQLLPDQQPDALQLKGIQAMLKALPLYDLDQVYVDQQALNHYGLTPEQLLLNTLTLDTAGLQALIGNSRNLLTF